MKIRSWNCILISFPGILSPFETFHFIIFFSSFDLEEKKCHTESGIWCLYGQICSLQLWQSCCCLGSTSEHGHSVTHYPPTFLGSSHHTGSIRGCILVCSLVCSQSWDNRFPVFFTSYVDHTYCHQVFTAIQASFEYVTLSHPHHLAFILKSPSLFSLFFQGSCSIFNPLIDHFKTF